MTRTLSVGFSGLVAVVLIAGLLFIFATVQSAAARDKVQDYAIMLPQPASGPEVLTQTTTSTVIYLPVVFQGFCASTFSFNETLRYNLTKIEAATAWEDSCVQGQNIIVAVVDTGIDLDHPDLQANLVAGKSFVSGTSSADDDYGHGTHVAGIVAAINNNGGVIGVAPAASLMPVKVLNSSASGSFYDVAAGVQWAVNNGAKIINLSLGGVSNSSTLQTAVNYAYSQGALVIAAGGNCGDANYALNKCSYQDQPVYPGAYSQVLAVASTTSTDSQSSFSNQGSYIDIAAPGSSIYSTYYGGGYTTLSGTSMAAPHVAGLAALIWSKNTSLTNAEVWAQLVATADDLGATGWDNQFGYGRINAAAAMTSQQITTALPAEVTAADTVTDTTQVAESAYVPGEILIKLADEVAVSDVIAPAQLAAAEVQVMDAIDEIRVQRLAVPAGQEEAWLAQLRDSTGVEYAELNYLVTIH